MSELKYINLRRGLGGCLTLIKFEHVKIPMLYSNVSAKSLQNNRLVVFQTNLLTIILFCLLLLWINKYLEHGEKGLISNNFKYDSNF